jgi:hypothetical protein
VPHIQSAAPQSFWKCNYEIRQRLTVGAKDFKTTRRMVNAVDHLMNLSSHLVDSLNTRAFHIAAPMYMVADFGGSHSIDQTPWSVSSRDEIISEMYEFLKMNPDFHTEILDMSVDIDSTSTAKVWVRRTDTGLAHGMILLRGVPKAYALGCICCLRGAGLRNA